MPPLVMGRDTPLKYCFEESPKYADGYKAAADLRAMYDTDTGRQARRRRRQGPRGPEAFRRHPRRRGRDHQGAASPTTSRSSASPSPARIRPTRRSSPSTRCTASKTLGLLKMDFLGLRNLDVITDTVGDGPAPTRDPEFDIDDISLDDATTFALLSARRHDRRVPARVAADAAAAARRSHRPLRRRRRPDRALPARADGRQHALRLRRPQERPQAGRVLPPRRRGGARRHVRPDDLSGERDAGRPEVRRLHARRGRQPAQGRGQEDPRDDGQGAGVVRGRGAIATGYGELLGKQLFDIIEQFADYAFNKSHCVRVRPRHLPDGVPQGALPGRVPRLSADEREEQPRQGGRVPRRLPFDGHQGAAARRQPFGRPTSPRCRRSEVADDISLPVGSPGAITFGLSAVRNVGEGLVELLVERARRERPVRQLPRLRRARARARAQQAHRRIADQGRRLRLARAPPARPARRCSNTSSTRR